MLTNKIGKCNSDNNNYNKPISIHLIIYNAMYTIYYLYRPSRPSIPIHNIYSFGKS